MSPLSHIPPRLQRMVVPYILVILTLIAIGTAVTFRVQAGRDASQSAEADAAIRAAAIANCRRQNEVRRIARIAVVTLATVQIESLQDEIDRSHSIPPRFFPNIPPARFHKLIQKQNSDRRHSIRRLVDVKHAAYRSFRDTDCQAANQPTS